VSSPRSEAQGIRALTGADAPAYQRLRLEGLRDSPTAFASHYEDERHSTVDTVVTRLEPTPDRVTFGAFEDGSLIGIVGIVREARRNLRHKALIFGMYVTPASRKKGVGHALLEHTLGHAAGMSGLRQINLCVNATNASAIAMYRAAGFELFGMERAFLIVDGAAQDLMHMVRVLGGDKNA
jgi:ribosomal protein S18 acetylase RimI-like enzyme